MPLGVGVVAMIVLAFAATGSNATAPRPLVAVERVSIPLSGSWRFRTDQNRVGVKRGWFGRKVDDARWAEVQVPHTWNVMPSLGDYEGVAWYRRSFALPPTARNARLVLRFAAVFYVARVWLNGKEVGRHEGGYTPFALDAGNIAKPGTNVLAVRVDNVRAFDRLPAQITPSWSFDWWNYGGIVREVSVDLSSRAHLERPRIVAVPHLTAVDEADTATVTARVAIANSSTANLAGSVDAQIASEDGTSVSRRSQPVTLAPGKSARATLTLSVASPRLWHFDHPDLYRLTVTLTDGDGTVLDRRTETFGIRSIELRDGGLFLNGERVRLVGLSRHADSPTEGLAESPALIASDYDDLKQLNEVLTRPVHYPQSDRVLDYADRNGILLVPEVPAWQLSASQLADPRIRRLERAQLRELVTSQANHPCVWAWSVANEIESDSPDGARFVRDAIAYVKSLDPTRPVGFASNRLNGNPVADATRLADFVFMNEYFGTWAGPKQGLGPALDRVHAAFPNKTVFISEFGFEPSWNRLAGEPDTALDPAERYVAPDGAAPGSDEVDAVRRRVIAEQMAVFRTKPFVAGAIFWTYEDYRTRSHFVMGVVDANRHRRGSWQTIREEFSPAEIESVEGRPGGAADVTLRARGDLPAYTLRSYRLRWSVLSPDAATTLAEGELAVPTLPPGARTTLTVRSAAPGVGHVLRLEVVRPTGFVVIRRDFHV
jgi:beta-glucuronidase